jgi:hypothetical protein
VGYLRLIAPNVFSGTYEDLILIAASLLIIPERSKIGIGSARCGPADLDRIGDNHCTPARCPAATATEIMFEAVLVGLPRSCCCTGSDRRGSSALVLALWRPSSAGQALKACVASSVFIRWLKCKPQRAVIACCSMERPCTVPSSLDWEWRAAAGPPQPLTYYYFGGPAGSDRGHAFCIKESCNKSPPSTWDGSLAATARTKRCGPSSRLTCCGAHCARFRVFPLVRVRSKSANRNRRCSFDLAVYGTPVQSYCARCIFPRTRSQFTLTREALAGYLAYLSRHGCSCFISRTGTLIFARDAAGAAKASLTVIAKRDDRANNSFADWRSNALVAVLARNAAELGRPNRRGWVFAQPQAYPIERRLF